VVVAFLTQPRIQAYLPGQQRRSLDAFIETVKTNKAVDPKSYWQFREFYSLGNFSFDPHVVNFGETQIIAAVPDPQTVLLKYDSPRLQSTDYIVKRDLKMTEQQQMAEVVVATMTNETGNVTTLATGPNLVLAQDASHHYLLVFANSIEQMRTANGFFNYTPEEQKLLQNTFWLNVTHLQ